MTRLPAIPWATWRPKLVETLGGRRLPYAGHRCDGHPAREGANTVYGPCVVRLVQAPGDTSAAPIPRMRRAEALKSTKRKRSLPQQRLNFSTRKMPLIRLSVRAAQTLPKHGPPI